MTDKAQRLAKLGGMLARNRPGVWGRQAVAALLH